MSYELRIQGKTVPLTYEDNGCRIGKEQLRTLQGMEMSEASMVSVLNVKGVHIQHIDKFGPQRIGFVKFRADALNQNNKYVPGVTKLEKSIYAFIQYEQVDHKCYTLLAVQPRIPAAISAFHEIPAGMLDGGVFVGVAARELKEETGLEIPENELVCLTDKAFGTQVAGMYPSPGGCDEYIKLYLYRKSVSQDFINNLEGQIKGILEHGETITLRVIQLENMWKMCPDGKSLSAYCLYTQLIANNTISDSF